MQTRFAVFLAAALVLVSVIDTVDGACQVDVNDSKDSSDSGQLGICKKDPCDSNDLQGLLAAFGGTSCAISFDADSGHYTCNTNRALGTTQDKCTQFRGVCRGAGGSWSSDIPGCKA